MYICMYMYIYTCEPQHVTTGVASPPLCPTRVLVSLAHSNVCLTDLNIRSSVSGTRAGGSNTLNFPLLCVRHTPQCI